MESTMEQIIIRQLNEDIQAYKIDIEWCNNQMKANDVTPQEMRTLQLRLLDLNHSMRHSQHRIEQLQIEMLASTGSSGSSGNTGGMGKALPYAQTTETAFSTFPRPEGAAVKRAGVPLPNGPVKRSRDIKTETPQPQRLTVVESPSTAGTTAGLPQSSNVAASGASNSAFFDDEDDEEMHRTLLHGNNNLQRLGYWKCRLCTSQKYIDSKNNRLPAAPCKWPLKDVAKMIAHFTDLHTEHEPGERCMELGTALDRNRGPFQYWLTRSHSQNLEGNAVNDVISSLYSGRLPPMLRKLSRAARAFPEQG